MAPGSYTTRRSPCVNLLANIFGEQDKLVGTPERSNTGSNETPTPPKAPTPPLVPPPAKDLFTKFMKVFMETIQAQALAKSQERPLKARNSETY